MNYLGNLRGNIKGSVTIINGPVGSGKSTLLNLLLEEIELSSGSMEVNGSVSYCSQGPKNKIFLKVKLKLFFNQNPILSSSSCEIYNFSFITLTN